MQHVSIPLIHVWYRKNKMLIATDTPLLLKVLLLVPPPTRLRVYMCAPLPSFLDAVTYEKSYFISTLLVDI